MLITELEKQGEDKAVEIVLNTLKELNNEDKLLIIEAVKDYLEILEEVEYNDEKYIKELNSLLKRL